jgi:hypothetical protein
VSDAVVATRVVGAVIGSSFACNTCGARDTRVKDSRPSHFGTHIVIRRRRLCLQCQARSTTIEIDAEALASLAGTDPAGALRALGEIDETVMKLRALLQPSR